MSLQALTSFLSEKLGFSPKTLLRESDWTHVQDGQWKDQRTVLKVFLKDCEEASGATALLLWQNQGSIPVLAHGKDYLLMPFWGADLRKLEEETALESFIQICRRFHSQKELPSGFRRVEELGRILKRSRTFPVQPFPKELLQEVRQVFDHLCETTRNPILLHGDLHHENILHHPEQGLCLIDPKGLLGEAEYEAGAFLRNPDSCPQYTEEPEQIKRRIQKICAGLDWDPRRVLGWSWCQAVFSTLWCVEDGFSHAQALRHFQAVHKLYQSEGVI